MHGGSHSRQLASYSPVERRFSKSTIAEDAQSHRMAHPMSA